MKERILTATLSIILLAGCLPQSDEVEILVTKPLDYELYLYSESDQEEAAQNYLGALLDWKMKQKDNQELKFEETHTHSNQVEVSKEQMPILIVKKDGKTLTTISGDNPQQEILMTLENSVTFVK